MQLRITATQAEILKRRNPGMTVEQAANCELARAMRDGTADKVGRSRQKRVRTKALLILVLTIAALAYAAWGK